MKNALSGVAAFILMFGFYQVAAASTMQVPDGGTGATSFSAGSLLLGNGVDPIIAASTLTFLNKLNPYITGLQPTLTIGDDSTASLNLFTFPANESTWIQANSAASESGRNGTGMGIFGGDGDGNGNGGAITIAAGGGRGTGSNGSVAISANNNSNGNGGYVSLVTTNASVTLAPSGAIEFQAGQEDSSQGMVMVGGETTLVTPGSLTILNPGEGRVTIAGEYNILQAIRNVYPGSSGGAIVGTPNASSGHLDILGGNTIWKLQNAAGDDGSFNIIHNSDINVNGGDNYSSSSLKISTSGDITIPNNIEIDKHITFKGATPTLISSHSDCGISPSIVGSDNAGRVTAGTGANGNKCTITFAQAWANPPICITQRENQSTSLRPANVTTTSFQIIGSINAGDTMVYQCVGY